MAAVLVCAVPPVVPIEVVPIENFSDDFPFGGTAPIVSIVEGLQTCGFGPQELRGIDRENALRILPKYKA